MILDEIDQMYDKERQERYRKNIISSVLCITFAAFFLIVGFGIE